MRHDELMHTLKTTRSDRRRNAAAISLADMGSSAAVQVLIDLLGKARTAKSRGTLLYALSQLQAVLPFEVLAAVILDPVSSYEARQEALSFFRRFRFHA